MGLYIYESEAEALRAIDLQQLRMLVDEAVWQSSTGELRALRIASCGEYVSGRLYRLDRAIIAHNKAKAAKKRSETSADVRRAAYDLVDAVSAMKQRLEVEEAEKQLFYVDDAIRPPYRFSPRLDVRINYRWRNSPDENWTFGSITFLHEVDMRPDYTLPVPKRKPSRAKQEDELQEKLYQTWDHLRSSALHSVQEYLRSGKDRSAIPETFPVTTDARTRGLNNYSTQFWGGQS